MRAGWTGSGACINGSTAHPRGATKRACGGDATTSTASPERHRGCGGATAEREISRHGPRASLSTSVSWPLFAAVRYQCGGHDRLLQIHVGDGRDADARRLDDVDGVDADAWTDVAGCRGVVRRHVDRDDGGDDA